MPRLHILHRTSVFAGRELALDKPVVRVGRDPSNDVVFDEEADRAVSRFHAEIRWEAQGPVFVPSAGRVVLRGGLALAGPTPLRTGDVLEFAGPGGPSIEVRFEPPRIVVGAQVAVDHAASTIVGLPAFVAGEGFVGARASEPSAPAPQQAAPPKPPFPEWQPPEPAPHPTPLRPPLPVPQPIPEPRPQPVPAPIPQPVPPPVPQPVPAPIPQPVTPPEPQPPATPEKPPEPQATAAPPPRRIPQVAPLDASRTMALPAYDPYAATGNATQLLPMVAMPPPEPKKKQWVRAVAAGLVALLVVAGAGVGVVQWQRTEKRRRAVERVERLREALRRSQPPPEVSNEDWELYEEELANRRGEEKPEEKPAGPVPEPAAGAGAKARAEAEALKKRDEEAAAAAEKKRLADELASVRAQARKTFAAMKRNELARFALGRPKDRAGHLRRQELSEERKSLDAQYVGLVAKADALAKPTGVDAIIRRTARFLGECDAAIPAKFLADTRTAMNRLKTDATEREALTGAIKRAADFGYGPTITAALGDQRVPVELFFVPLVQSGFDERRIGLATERGYPKGMWQLVPAVAEKYGLKLGSGAATPAFDSGDERHRYEKEAKAAARAMRDLYRGPAAGSALLVLATYDFGDTALLGAAKQKAGLGANDTDPERVSFWRIFEAGALDEAHRKAAVNTFATIAVASEPGAFGLSFAPPLEHVVLADD